MRKTIGSIICGLTLSAFGQTPPATHPAAELPNITVSEMKVEDMQQMTFLHFQQTTTIAAMKQTIGGNIEKLMTAAKAAGIDRRGPLLILMHGVTDDPARPFDLQAGFKIEKGAVAPAGYVITDLPPTKTAVVLYSGPLMEVRRAYSKLYSDIVGAGFAPSTNIREYILYYEDVDSPNNVAMAGIELQ